MLEPPANLPVACDVPNAGKSAFLLVSTVPDKNAAAAGLVQYEKSVAGALRRKKREDS
jgi:hypothetical protein